MVTQRKTLISPLLVYVTAVACVWISPGGAGSKSAADFEKLTLTHQFWSEGSAIGDLNADGYEDVVSGPFWYEGPSFKKHHEFRSALGVNFLKATVDPKNGQPPEELRYSDSFIAFVYDLNGDGWPDILSINAPGKEASWYENPGKSGLTARKLWKRHIAFDMVGNESPTFGDLLGTGKPVLLFMSGGYLGYATPDWKNPESKWKFHAISSKGSIPDDPYIHGLGFGDVNGDGRADVLEATGWWEQPSSLNGDPAWKFHAFQFGDSLQDPHEGGAQMYAYDVNGDGLNDVICSLEAHGYGLAWFEQLKTRSPSGEIQFNRHIIIGRPSDSPYRVSFSQLHAVALADINGDGLKDIVTGKRFWAHGRYGDPEPNAPAVLYWFELVRGASGEADFVPHLIDTDSGVGTQVVVGDLNGDALPDVVVGNKKGTFVFLQRTRAGKDAHK